MSSSQKNQILEWVLEEAPVDIPYTAKELPLAEASAPWWENKCCSFCPRGSFKLDYTWETWNSLFLVFEKPVIIWT